VAGKRAGATTPIHQPPTVRMKVADLNPARYNPRRISSSAMAGLEVSIETFGLVQPPVYNKRSGTLVGGHQRLKKLRAAKVQEVDVVVVDLDEDQEHALNVALNNPNIAGVFTDRLQQLLEQIRSRSGDLYDRLRFDTLVDPEYKGTSAADPDNVPDIDNSPARTKLGDVYFLGRHKLICGDSADPGVVKRLLGDEVVHSLVTDPPYGIDYDEKLSDMRGARFQREMEGDQVRADFRPWCARWMKNVPWANYATVYVFMSSQNLHNLRLAFDDAGFHFCMYLLWLKNAPVLARTDYNAQTEFIAYGLPSRDAAGEPTAPFEMGIDHEYVAYGWPDRHRFFGKVGSRSTVMAFDRPHKSLLHPTMKPVALLEQIVQDGSPPGGIVLDLFGGSGSTMIACEQAGRSARLVELHPKFCDVTVARWEELTGLTAVRHANQSTRPKARNPRAAKARPRTADKADARAAS
jgi:DNA modification methylase